MLLGGFRQWPALIALVSLSLIWFNAASQHEDKPRIASLGTNQADADPDTQSEIVGRGPPANSTITAASTHSLATIRALSLQNRYNEALSNLADYLDTQMPPDERIQALSLGTNLAINYRDYPLAFKWLDQALELHNPSRSPESSLEIFYQAAYALNMLGRHQEASAFAKQAVDLARALKKPRDECYAQHQYLLALVRSAELSDPSSAFRNALSICDRTNDPVISTSTRALKSEAHLLAGQPKAAVNALKDVAPTTASQSYELGVLEAMVWKASALRDLGYEDQALPMLLDAAKQLEEYPYSASLLQAHRELADALWQAKRPADAYVHLQSASTIARQIETNRREMEIAYLETKFLTEMKSNEVKLLQRQLQIAALEAKTNKQQKILQTAGYLVAGLLLLILALLVIHSRRDRRHFLRLSERDSLTGLLNHRAFFTACQAWLNKHGGPAALIMADADHFKKVNDQHGHSAGDAVLRAIASHLRTQFPEQAIIGRIGGEEFVVFLGGEACESAIAAIEALRAAIERSPVAVDKTVVHYTLSFGVATARDRESAERLRQRADEALYQAKNGGRDQVVVAPSTDPLKAGGGD